MHVPANVLSDAADTEALSMSRDAGAAPQAGEPASWSIRGAQTSAEEASFPHAGLGGGDGEGEALLNVGRARKPRSNGKG